MIKIKTFSESVLDFNQKEMSKKKIEIEFNIIAFFLIFTSH